jgi:PBP1b-binding outer membrane lipoprotein LpoB
MHKKNFHRFLVIAALTFLLVVISGCLKKDEQQAEEKDRIERMTDKAAGTAVKKIRTPIAKARATQSLGNERQEEIDKAMQKQ